MGYSWGVLKEEWKERSKMGWNGGWYYKKIGPFQLQYKFPFKVKVKLIIFG